VLSALLAVLTVNACAAGNALDAVAAADDWATASATPTECVDDDADETVTGDDDVVATLTVAECVEFDPVLAVVDVVCSASGAEVAGGAHGWVVSVTSPEPVGVGSGCGTTTLVPVGDGTLADAGGFDACDSVVLACAPPLLLTVTPDATWSVDDVAPDVFVVSVALVPLPVDVDPPLVDVEPVPVAVVDEVADPVVDVAADPVLEVAPAELVEDASEDVPDVSAAAKP
jgi:hypothetical protein